MKGIIFNVFEQLVARDRGEAAWGRLLEDRTWKVHTGDDRCILGISCSR